MYRSCFFLFFFFSILYAQAPSIALSPSEQLFQDLETVHQVDQKIQDRLPLLINYQLQIGYFTMPSARTYDTGVFGFGVAQVGSERIWSLGFQFFDHIEATANYWPSGTGHQADPTANLKCILLRKEEGFFDLPNFACGWNELLTNCQYQSFYVAATKEFLKQHLEATLGWGCGKIQGFFGGVAWSPFRSSSRFWKNLSLVAEYDATDYPSKVKSRINGGFQWNIWDFFRLSFSSFRGCDWAAGGSFHYDFGGTRGLFPKVYDTPIYVQPIDTQPIGLLRKREELAQEMAFACKEQGFDLYSLYLIPKCGEKDELWMKVINVRYRQEAEVRRRLEHILAALTPSNISHVTVVLEADGVVEYEYRFRTEDLTRYRESQLGEYEFDLIAPMKEASSVPNSYEAALLYHRKKAIWILTFRPWLATFFGTQKGKLKYETGFVLGPEGYLFDQLYYCLNLSITALSSVKEKREMEDPLNPSRIVNVRTDTICYHQSGSFHVDQAYVQKSSNFGKGCFSRLAAGYFETAFAGVALETLYYPIRSNWAVGFEIAGLLKRNYYGLGFQHKVRRYTDSGVTYVPYTGFQYFVDFYYDYKPLSVDFRIRAGQFLAWDKGIRIEAGRTFQSGLRVGLWYTLTNGKDVVNHQRYYDKGFSLSLPLDWFMNQSSRTRIQYAMAERLRDVGAISYTGKNLYQTLYWERYNGSM